MAIISAGYDGTVDETQFANMLPKCGACEYGVDLAGDFAVTAVAGQDRVISVAPGKAWGHSVVDVMDTNETRALAAPVSGSRWDLVVLRRDWQPPGGATTVQVIQGGPSNVTLPARNTGQIGIIDDQPLALVRVDAGSTTIGGIIDLRVWARNGGVTAIDEMALQYLGAIGAEVKIGRDVYSRVKTSSGATWQRSYEKYMITSGASQYTLAKDATTGHWQRVNFPAGIFQSGVTPNVQLTLADRVEPYALGRAFVEMSNIDHTGFSYRGVRTDLSENRATLRFWIHWLAMQ